MSVVMTSFSNDESACGSTLLKTASTTERYTKQATDNFQRRALLRKIMETIKDQFSISLSQI